MRILRIYDPGRHPPGWMDIVNPGQFVAFAKDLDSGVPCDADGRAFADSSEATCVLFDSLDEARAFCETALQSAPAARFDVFDAGGRAHAPLLTLVHPSRAQVLDTHPRVLRTRRLIAWALIAAGIPLITYAYWEHTERETILPAFIGINLLLAAGRLFWFNLGVRETERARQERLKRLDR